MSNKLPWVLSEWHNISSSSAPIKMDGVLFQDIKSIISVVLKHPEVQEWTKSIHEAYTHLSDTNNPHQTSIDHFKTKVIEVIYSVWRSEGYRGTLQEFTDIFFLYIQIVQYAELIDNLDNELMVPSVKAVYEYIKVHDESLDVHEDLLKSIFKGFVPNVQPGISIFQYVGVSEEDMKYFNETTKMFENYPAFDNVTHPRKTMTIISTMRFTASLLCFGIHSATTKEAYQVYTDPSKKEVRLEQKSLTGVVSVLGRIDMTPLMDSVLDPDRHLAVAMMFDGPKITLAVDMSLKDHTLPNLTTVVATIPIQTTPRGPINPRLMFASLNRGNPLQSIVVYRQAMDNDQLSFLFAGYQYPIIQTLTNIAMTDRFSVIQNEQLTILNSQLTGNDYLGNSTIATINYHSPVHGTLTPGINRVIFKSNGQAREPAGFKYTTTNNQGIISTGNVIIDVLSLPEIEAYFFKKQELADWILTFQPPSMLDVFNTWTRISDLNAYYPPGTTPQGEATKWQMIGLDNFGCSINSVHPTALISPNKYNRYTFEATMSSTNTDDDYIGALIAFKRINEVNHFLWAARACTGGGASKIEFCLYHTTYNPNVVTTSIKSSSDLAIWSGNLSTNNGQGWNVNSPTKLRVERTPTGVIVSCSPWKSTDLSLGVSLSINFNDYPALNFCKEETPYGFICLSQQYSKWTDVIFNGGDRKDDEAYDFESNVVWKYINNTWVKTKITLQQALGYPRVVKSVTTGKRYQISEKYITEIK